MNDYFSEKRFKYEDYGSLNTVFGSYVLLKIRCFDEMNFDKIKVMDSHLKLPAKKHILFCWNEYSCC